MKVNVPLIFINRNEWFCTNGNRKWRRDGYRCTVMVRSTMKFSNDLHSISVESRIQAKIFLIGNLPLMAQVESDTITKRIEQELRKK